MSRFGAPQLAPLFLRLALGVTFVWAGLGKVEGRMRVSGESAATLANMGLQVVRQSAKPAPPTVIPGAEPSPLAPLVGAESKPGDPTPGAATGETASVPPVSPPDPTVSAAPPQPVLPTDLQPTAPTETSNPLSSAPEASVVTVYTAKDFPSDVEVKRVYSLSMLLHRSAHPPARADGTAQNALWPKRLTRGSWALFFAWSVAVGELAGGAFVLGGLLTRWSASALALVMLGAMWLTEIGPAMSSGSTMLGFLPERDWLATEQWKTLMWQFSLLMSAVTLAILGSGALGLDRKLFPPAPPPPTRVKPMM